MRRVENEKQQQQRLASYAHLEEQERREAWQKLSYVHAVCSGRLCSRHALHMAHPACSQPQIQYRQLARHLASKYKGLPTGQLRCAASMP